MGIEALIGNADDRTVRTLIDQACALTGKDTGNRAPPPDFARRLFERVAPEDLARYTAEELAHLAANTWDFLAIKPSGGSKVRFYSPPKSLGERLKQISIVEIVNDDMPFLVDSVMGELAAQNLDIHLVAHPVLDIVRDSTGKLTGIDARGSTRESVINIHVGRVEDEARQRAVIAALEAVLSDVGACVADWQPMIARLKELIAGLKASPPLPQREVGESVQFLEWLLADNFTFLGMRDYVLSPDGSLQPKFETGLGLMRGRYVHVLSRAGQDVQVTPQVVQFLLEPRVLIVMKANTRSRVHRRAYLDYIGVKRFDASGKLLGEFRIIGLFTSTAYTRSARAIPYLRRKVDAVLARAGFDPEGHSGKALANVLETYPRDELFQVDEETLYHFAIAILHLDEHPRVRVLARLDRFDRFVSVLVFAPRDRYDSRIRAAIGAYLAEVYQGHVSAFYPFYTEGPLVRVHFIIGRRGGTTPDPDRATLEAAVSAIVRTWSDGLGEALASVYDPARARALAERYSDAFSAAYREAYPPSIAVADIKVIEGLSAERPLGVEFYRHEGHAEHCGALKVWSYDRPIPLSERVPVLEHMGFRVVDESTYHADARDPGGPSFWLHDMTVERSDGGAIDLAARKGFLETALLMVMRGLAENDGYNALVLAAGLGWRDVALIRALSRYLRQVRVPFSQDYMWTTLRRHSVLASKIVALFHLRFDPHLKFTAEARTSAQNAVVAEIEAELGAVDSLDEDRILRRFVNAVTSALRTNYYQLEADGQPRQVIAIKFDSRKIDGMPLPKPLYEIFVYSPRVEGVHLRFGRVARGGIRWSDRPQDFRTEVLGLVKAQQVKNAVIVPNGAKGGFVPKHMPSGPREAIQAEGVATYRIFISTLLDITDNIGPDGVIPPKDVVRHDGDDPYFVVAADKGTATFSDIANGIAQEHGFWLDDAFASGGSAGYDHKGMGITARGAWEAVKRHFREVGTDTQTQDFTVVGVGDMAGDVFGNGMLLSRHIRLVAAFNHIHVFLDPDPDAEASWKERKRLFDLPRSAWSDYDPKLISAGGGVYERKAKSIKLSAQVKKRFAIAKDSMTPAELIQLLLKAEIDLLWLGGIGTYVKASEESHADVGDRANDALRVNATDLRCKVVGEGANLGFTQRARIEYALKGGRINTDAVDNSAGVDTSDHEVNIKILLNEVVAAGDMTRKQRDRLLKEITDDVAALVLCDNYLQTQCLSVTQMLSARLLDRHMRFVRALEKA